MNDLYAAYDRLTPADLQRVAARYFTPGQRDGVILETEKPEMSSEHRSPGSSSAGSALPRCRGSLAIRLRWPSHPQDRQGRSAERRPDPFAVEPAGRVPVRVPRRLAERPQGKEGLAALTAAMVAEGGTKSLTYDQLLEAVLPDGREPRRRLPQGGHGLRRASSIATTSRPISRWRPRCSPRPGSPPRLRAAAQRGPRLRDQDPPRQ